MKKGLILVTLLLFYSLALLLFIKPVFAQETFSSPLQTISVESYVPINVSNIEKSLSCEITGWNPHDKDGKGCVYYDKNGNLMVMEKPGGGAVAFTGNLIAAMYSHPPASGVQYLADLGKNLGIVSPAYAAVGTGFTGLTPILPIWKAFRNIAYLFFTIIFIVVGFAIMFRLKISPQAVVTIQSALPRMIMTLILVTFSYAIAGFLIDLMYALILLAIVFLANAGVPSIGPSDIPGLQAQFTGGFEGAVKGVFQVVGWGLPFAFLSVGGIIGAITGAIAGLGALPGAVLGVALFLLIMGVTVLFLVFRLFIELLKAYIGIIVGVIFAPLQIMLGAIPGQSGFGAWFRTLLANVLIFPAVAIFLLIGRSLMSVAGLPFVGGGLWTPPMFGFPTQILPAIIALGILFLVTKVPEMVKNALQVRPFPYGAAIGEAVGPVRGMGRAGYLYGAGETARWLEGPSGTPPSWRQTVAGVIRQVSGVRRS